MNVWNYIVTFCKLRFGGGFESAADYVLSLLADALEKHDTAGKIVKASEIAGDVVEWMDRLRKYCPTPWISYYESVYDVVKVVRDTFADGEVEAKELSDAVAAFRKAYESWKED